MAAAEIDYTDPAVIIGFIMAVLCDGAFLGIIGILIPGIGLVLAAFILMAHYFFGIALLAMFIYKMRGWMGKLLFVLGVLLPLPTLTLGLILGIIFSNKFIAFLGEQIAVLALSETVVGAGAVEAGAVAELGAEGTEAAVTAAEAGVSAAGTAAEVGVEGAGGAAAQGAGAAGASEAAGAGEGVGAGAESEAEKAMEATAERPPMEVAEEEELENAPEPEEKPTEEEAEETSKAKGRKVYDIAKRVGTKIDEATGGEDENEDQDEGDGDLPKAA